MEHDECAQAGWEQRGPRVVAIGGGTGLSTMLRGLKNQEPDRYRHRGG